MYLFSVDSMLVLYGNISFLVLCKLPPGNPWLFKPNSNVQDTHNFEAIQDQLFNELTFVGAASRTIPMVLGDQVLLQIVSNNT